MSLNVEYPNITGANQAEEIASIKSYLYRLADSLNLAETGAAGVMRELSAAMSADLSRESKERVSEYGSLRALVVKTAESTVSECSESIAKEFSSRFIARSDFGTLTEELSQTVTENSAGIERLFGYTAGINSRDEASVLSTKQYVKTGLLYYENGVPVYGVGVGLLDTTLQSGNTVIDISRNRLLAVTPTGIDFWESGSKIASVNSGALYLPAAVITGGSINIGDGSFTVNSNGAVTATSGSIGGCDIVNGVLNISGANITSGTISAALIPDLSSNYATVGRLNSAIGRIEDLEADFADIDLIIADEIEASGISADYISGGTLNCNNIAVSNLVVTNSMISSVGAGKISAGSNANALTFSNLTHSGGKVAGWDIHTNYMTYGSARVGSGYFQVYSGSSWAAYEPTAIEYSYQGATTVHLTLRSIATTSLEEAKRNISEYEGSALDLVKSAKLYGYEYRAFPGEKRYGFVIGRECPDEIIDAEGENINLYDMCAFSWAAIKELSEKLDSIKQ